jgi:uncharacterized membrane protein
MKSAVERINWLLPTVNCLLISRETHINGFTHTIDRLIYAISRHWPIVFSALAAVYVGLPILAPALMAAGLERPGRLLYTIYSPMCHQMASRSFFLFGEQYAYPRAIAGTNLTPIEAYIADVPEFAGISADPADWPDFMLAARSFVGNSVMGYKMALCERDIGIWGFFFIGGLVYAFARRYGRVRPMPILLFILVGLLPIAFDGFSQLFSQFAVATSGLAFLDTLFPLRESTPFLRALTGALFGFSLVWLTYPRIEPQMQAIAAEQAHKLGELSRRQNNVTQSR